MSLYLLDKVQASNRLSPAIIDGVISRIVEPDDKDKAFWPALAKYATTAGLDGAILAGQHLVETADQQSVRWNRDLNPGGIAIPADSTVQPFTINNVDESARIFVQCVYSEHTGKLHPDIPIPTQLQEWFDEVWMPKVKDPKFPGVDILDDLDIRYIGSDGEPRATWAWDGTDDGDPAYADKVVSRGNQFMPGLLNQGGTAPKPGPVADPIFGKVLHPDFQNRPISKPEGAGQNNLGKRAVYGVTLHRMLGSLWGTDGYFRLASVNALTDYGIGTLYQDGAGNDGLILRWNDPNGYQSGWASGPVSAPYGDGAKFVNLYGVNAVNRFRVSIEISGVYYTSPITAAVKWSIARLIAYYADQDQIPWDKFPIRPKDGLNFVLHHQHFTIGTGKVCSGDVVMEATAEIIEMARAIMKDAQGGNAPKPRIVPPVFYAFMNPNHPDFGKSFVVGTGKNATEIIYAPGDFTTAVNNVERWTNGSSGSPKCGDDMKKGVTFHSDYCFRSRDNNRSYRLTKNASRVYAAKLWPRDGITVNGTVSRKQKDGTKTVVRKPGEDRADTISKAA